MTEFTERYKKLSDRELLAILADASSYQPIAVETAKKELTSRQLTEDQLKRLETQNEIEKKQKEAQLQKRKEENEILKNDFFALLAIVNPFAKQLEVHEKQIRFISCIFVAIAICALVLNYTLIGFYLEDLFNGKIGVELILYFVNIISIVLGAILFWKRTTLGWILMTFYLATALAGVVCSFIYHLTSPAKQYYTIIDDAVMPTSIVGMYIIGAIFFGANLYVLLKEKVKNVFKIDKTIAVLTIFLAAGIQATLWFALFLRI
ncbi:hypothetical protein [uncultured Kordia sp.]|uniref:hypothetical protein n=1 Tax=uncultured Kordia sp. TaxID=507699 RepID=UPI0026129D6A|nr:hypothetical protein [uncultured Kordia sp.]